MPIWVEVVGRTGTVADGRDLAVGDVAAVHPDTARKLLAMGLVRVVEPPMQDPPVAEVRKRTR